MIAERIVVKVPARRSNRRNRGIAVQTQVSKLLNKGTGSEPNSQDLQEHPCRAASVPLVQQAAKCGEEDGGQRAAAQGTPGNSLAPGRAATRLRAERLQRTEIAYLYHDSFAAGHSEKTILRPPVANVAVRHAPRAPRGADFYLARMYEVPLLSPEQETYLFRKMNYLKYRADLLRQDLNPRTATVARLDKIEHLLAEAQTVRNQLIEANLRLVFSLAKRYAPVGSAAFDELVGEGHVTLMRAVEKFDFSRGVRFSTYASRALMNGCHALQRQASALRRTICAPCEVVDDSVTDYRTTAGEERASQNLHHAVDQMLLGLSSRERTIIEARFGFHFSRSPSLKEIGRGMGISKERVRQLQQRALDKLRALAEHYQVELPSN